MEDQRPESLEMLLLTCIMQDGDDNTTMNYTEDNVAAMCKKKKTAKLF